MYNEYTTPHFVRSPHNNWIGFVRFQMDLFYWSSFLFFSFVSFFCFALLLFLFFHSIIYRRIYVDLVCMRCVYVCMWNVYKEHIYSFFSFIFTRDWILTQTKHAHTCALTFNIVCYDYVWCGVVNYIQAAIQSYGYESLFPLIWKHFGWIILLRTIIANVFWQLSTARDVVLHVDRCKL